MTSPARLLACGFATLALITTVSAQEKKPADAAPAEKITFVDHVQPILRAKCGNCHSAGEAKGGLVLDSYGTTMTGGASGAVVEPGDLDGSRLWALVAHKEQPAMPPKEAKLPEDQLALINKWIAGGALENKNSVIKAKAKPSLTLTKTDNAADKPAGPPPMPENLSAEPLTLSPRGNVVSALSASPWAPLVALAGHKQVLLYDLTDFGLVGVLPFNEGSINVLRFSRNGTLLLAAGGRGGQTGKAVAFDVKTGKRVFESPNEPDAILAADISPDHTLIAVGGPKKLVHVYSTADGDLEYELKKHTDWITALEFSPDGTKLATADRSNGLIVWEAETGRELFVLNGHTAMINAVSWRVDSKILASASEDGTIRQWEMVEGKQFKNWNGHGGGATSIQFLRDGKLASTGRDKVTKLWDANGGQVRAFPALADLGLKVTFAETNGYILAGDWTGSLKVWNAADGAEKTVLVTNPQPLAARLEEAQKSATAAKAAAEQAATQLAALQKSTVGRKVEMEAAMKAAADAKFVHQAAVSVKNAATQLTAVRGDELKAAQSVLKTATATRDQAKAAKASAEQAGRDVAAATSALEAAEQALTEAKKAADAASANKTAADKSLTEANAQVNATAGKAETLKAAADKAAAVKPDPAAEKALAAAEALAKQTAEAAAAKAALVTRLTAEKNRPSSNVVASPK